MGEIKKQGISNAIISYIGIAIGFINLLVLQPILLSPEEIGLTRILFSFSALLATIIPMGMVNIILRFFPVFKNENNGNNGFFGLILLFVFVGFILISLLLFLVKPLFIEKYSQQSKLFSDFFYYVYPLSFFLALTNCFGGYLSSIFKTSFPSFVNDILIRLLNILIFSIYFFDIINLEILIFLYFFLYLFQAIILIIYISKNDKINLKINFSFYENIGFSKIIGYGLLFAIASISSLGLRYIDSVIMGMYLPLSDVGIYSVCILIPTIIETPLIALEKITNSKIANAWEKNLYSELEVIYRESVRILSVSGGMILVFILINVNFLFSFLPVSFLKAIPVVYIISIGSFINIFTGVNSGIIYYSKKYKIGLIALFAIFILTTSLNFLLIPIHGIIGAAIATTIGIVIHNVAKFLIVLHKFKLNPFTVKVFRIFPVIIVCLILDFVIPHLDSKYLDLVLRNLLFVLLMTVVVTYFKLFPEFNKYLPKKLFKNS